MKLKLLLAVVCWCILSVGSSQASDGKLIGTAGLVQLEGTGGGGIVPWATLAGYDSREEISINAFSTRVELDDYRLNALGASISLYDRVELSIAQQLFDVPAFSTQIEQQIVGVKVRIYGDVVYSKLPQISLGWQHKRLKDGEIAGALGAQNNDKGDDFYLAATKVQLDAVAGFNAVYNLAARATKANELGLLGFGGVENNDYQIMLEASVGLLLSRHLAIGFEYRQKPDNLGLNESDWRDFFISYIPNKHFSITAAWADLGTIAGAPDQQGIYLSINGTL